ncbi:MAG: hypothetical protein D6730_18265 [Bacteroidetes bacterium]|nr:MAG: hypothetical protein D6730_18265 [Bacteroidota bacterium]
MKRILVIYYSQTGQLDQIVQQFIRPFTAAGVKVERLRVQAQPPFEFPWSSRRFFDVMPESVLEKPAELAPFELKDGPYDLIVFAYQPWFLSPSIPASSLLQHPALLQVLRGSRVLTLIGARNMWLNAQEKVKSRLQQAGAQLVGNVALTDRHHNLASAVSIMRWMFRGDKRPFLGIFPPAGIAGADIARAADYGQTVLNHLLAENWSGLQPALVQQGAVAVKPNLMFIEERAGRLFRIWARLIANKKNRRPWLLAYQYYLLFALFVVAPVVLLVHNMFFRPFLGKLIRSRQSYYLGLKP